MSPRAYEAAKRLATDPRTPKYERESALQRVLEHDAAHAGSAPPGPPAETDERPRPQLLLGAGSP